MSFYGGGGGGGWPPPNPFFSQPPPTVPLPFYSADPSHNQQVQGFPHGMQPDFQQQGYSPYVQQVHQPLSQPVPIPDVRQPGVPPESATQSQEISSSPPQSEREHRRPEYRLSPDRYSPSPRDYRRSPDRGQRSYRNDVDDARYARKKRIPVDEQMYRRQGSEEHGRLTERAKPSKSKDCPSQLVQDKPKVDIDALLKDERLRNVLFAGISKATAKLEQSLQEGKETKDQSDFEPQEGKNQLFPSATSQKPRSILKRKDEKEVGGSKALTNLSVLERTLQMLRGKGDVSSDQSQSDRKSSLERNPPAHGALGKLIAYDEGNDEECYLYDSEKRPKEEDSVASSSTKPFWSLPTKLETSKRESDSFDVKEKMFEEWRQSIGKQSDSSSKSSQREMLRDVESIIEHRHVKKRDMPGGVEADNQEELDSTVQNILQSIGFNFDLSKRMQELARKKRRQEDEGSSGIRNASASFIDKSDILAEELRASLLQSGSDLSSIDTLIKEARASSQGKRGGSRSVRSPSPGRRESSYGRDVREMTQGSRQQLAGREDHYGKTKDRTPKYNIGADQWERISPEFSPQQQQRFSPPKRMFKERVSLSPVDRYEDQSCRSGPIISERFRDDGDRNEYFYPEKEFSDPPPSVPLLTSFSSRKKNEDLSGGLLKSLRVENLRVMSRPTNDYEDDDSYMETRRVILPARIEHDKGRLSPSRTVTRKRSASPMSMPVSKERKLSPGYRTSDYNDYPRRQASLVDSYQGRRSPVLKDSDTYISGERKKSPLRRRSPSPSQKRRERSKSPYKRRSRSPYRRKSPFRRRSPSPRHRSPSPRRRSPSPRRGRSKSPGRRRRSPGRRSPPSYSRRRSPARRSGRSRSRERNKQGISKYDTPSSSIKNRPDSKPKQKNLSKLTEKDRKAELQKMLTKRGVSVDATQASVNTEKSDGDCSSKVEIIVAALQGLSKMDNEQLKELTAKVLLLSADHQSKALNNIESRKAKVLALRLDLDRLKKVQNELMRKSQRSGLGNKDPHLKANNLSQLEIEKEIDRLSAPELAVGVQSNLSQTLKNIQSELEKGATLSASKPKAKNQNAKKFESTPTTQKTPASSTQDTKESIAQVMELAGQTSWTSVAVQEEDLPEIATPDSKDDKRSSKRKSIPIKPKRNIYYEYIDSGNHWCSNCHVNCNILDQYFNHLHGKKHFSVITNTPKPWVDSKDEDRKNRPKVGQAQTRRMKGSEMLFPVSGFYCTLCASFCGDFVTAEQHLKSDDHYDKYLEFLRGNPGYEKRLLLEKSTGKKQNENPNKKEPKATPPPLPPTVKKEKKAKSLRQKQLEEKEVAGTQDNLESVDMELDDDEQRDDDMDVKSKVPKMTGKPSNSVAAILSLLPGSGDANANVEMKSSKDDEVTSLDKFLTIAKDTDQASNKGIPNTKKVKKAAKIPVIGVKEELNLSDIPVPESTEVMVKNELKSIPLPSSASGGIASTVKTLQEVEEEEKRKVEEEKRNEKIMMGIDVDAEEEKPLAPVRPPPLPRTAGQTDKPAEKDEEAKGVPKPQSIDNLLAKVKFTSKKVKQQSISEETSELEMKIQLEIKEKLEREKQKLLKQQERKERMEKKLEEKKLMKKKVISDSSSEETESEEEEEEKTMEAIKNDIENQPRNVTKIDSEVMPDKQEGGQNFITLPSDSDVIESPPVEGKGENLRVDETTESAQISKEVGALKVKEDVPSDTGFDLQMEVQNEDGSSMNDMIFEGTEIKGNNKIKDESFNAEVSAGNTMEIVGLGSIAGFESQIEVKIACSGDAVGSDATTTIENRTEKLSPTDSVSPPKMDEPSKQPSEMDITYVSNADQQQQQQQMVIDNAVDPCPSKTRDSLIKAAKEVTKKSKEAFSGEEKINTEECVDAMSSSACIISSEMTKTVKTTGKKIVAMRKNAVVKALQSESDLLGVLYSSPEILSKRKPKKNQGAKTKKVIAKLGEKVNRAPKVLQPLPDQTDETEFSMDDFVILSEVAEDEGDDINNSLDISSSQETKSADADMKSVQQRDVSNDDVRSVDTLTKPTSDNEQAGKTEVEAIKPVSTTIQDRRGKISSRGRGRGKRAVVKKDPVVVASFMPNEIIKIDKGEQNSGEICMIENSKEANDISDNIEKSEQKSDENGRILDESQTSVNTTESTDVTVVGSVTSSVEKLEQDVEAPVVSRTRRGRSAAVVAKKSVKTTAGRQTRNRGKKNMDEVDILNKEETSASEEMVGGSGRTLCTQESKNSNIIIGDSKAEDSVEEDEIKTAKEESESRKVKELKSMPSLQPELADKEDLASSSENIKKDSKTRTLRSRQCKNTNLTMVVINEAVESIAHREEGEGESVNKEMPSLQPEEAEKDEPRVRSLRSRPKVATVAIEVEKEVQEKDADSDATITEDIEDSCSIDQASQDAESTPQVSNETSVVVKVEPVFLATNQPRDPPMSGVVSEIDTTCNMEMPTEGEGIPMTTDDSEFENLPTAGLNFGLEDNTTDSVEFAESMEFSVIDVEGNPDDGEEIEEDSS